MNKLHYNLKRGILIVSILLFMISINFTLFSRLVNQSNSSNKVQDKIFEFDNLKVSGQGINITTPENITYTAPMSGYYPATYGFENDAIGSDPMEWSVYEVGGTVNAIDSLGNHNKIVEVHNTAGDHTRLTNIFSTRATGTIECWVRTNTIIDESIVLRAVDGPSTDEFLISVNSATNKWEYNDGGTWYDMTTDIAVNTWYHFRIEFDCADDWHVWIDGVSQDGGTGFGYRSSPTQMDRFIIGTTQTATECYAYFDAVGYSWDPNYNIGDNLNEGLLLSYENSTNLFWKGYSLDGQANKTILGNTTFPIPDNGLHNIQVFGNASIGTIYQSDMRYFSIDYFPIKIHTPENKTYTTPMSGYYPATYGFENDAIGSDPMEWSVYEVGGTVNVITSLGNHNKIVEVHNTAGDHTRLTNTFSAIATGTIECWVRTNTIINESIVLRAVDGPTTDEFLISVNSATNKWEYNDGGTWYDMTTDIAVNTWYHFRIEFDCADDWHVWIDGVSQDGGTGFGYRSSPTQMDRFIIGTTQTATECYAYFDAVGYSWDPNYNIGDNLNEGLLLSFDTNLNLNWIRYSLDDKANKTILGNITIPMPNDGLHSIQVFGNDYIGNDYQSNVRYFSIGLFETPSEPIISGYVIPLLIASICVVIIITIKKRFKKRF